MKNKIRPIDAKAAGLKVSEYMREHANTAGKYVACMGIIGILGSEEETPTLTGFVPDYNAGPLTLEQLRGKIDEPVYLYIYDTALSSGWHIIKAVTKDKIIFRGWDTVYVPISSIGKCFDLYAYPPARIDRERWEPCEWCGSIGEKPDNWVCTLEDDNGHTVTNNHMVVCAPVNYCPVCGRPLTPEAWEEMERRVNG